MGTIIFIALQPLLMHLKTSSKNKYDTCCWLHIGVCSKSETIQEWSHLFAICCLVLSIIGILMYAVTDKGLSAHRSNKTTAKIVFFLLLIFSLVCNAGGNITLLCSSECAVQDKNMYIIMLLIIIATSIFIFFSKNYSAGKIHICALVIRGLSLKSPFMYILLLLIIAKIFTLTGKFSIYTSN